MVDTQNSPIEDGANDALESEQIDGIVGQVRGDVAIGNEGDVEQLLRERLSDAQISVSDEQFSELLAAVKAPQ